MDRRITGIYSDLYGVSAECAEPDWITTIASTSTTTTTTLKSATTVPSATTKSGTTTTTTTTTTITTARGTPTTTTTISPKKSAADVGEIPPVISGSVSIGTTVVVVLLNLVELFDICEDCMEAGTQTYKSAYADQVAKYIRALKEAIRKEAAFRALREIQLEDIMRTTMPGNVEAYHIVIHGFADTKVLYPETLLAETIDIQPYNHGGGDMSLFNPSLYKHINELKKER